MAGRIAIGLALVAAALLLGLWIALVGTPAFDPPIVHALAGQRHWPGFWLAVTHVGDGWPRSIAGLAIVAALFWAGRRRAGIALFGTMLAIAGANSLLKLLFARPRPDLLDHLDRVSNLSFPSGHAANNMAFYLLLVLLIDRRLAVVAVPMVVLIGVSRIVLGVHWPSDIVAGWLVGAGFALVGWALADRVPTSRA